MAREPVGDDAGSKIKAWQQRRMSKKRESFTVRGDTNVPNECGSADKEQIDLKCEGQQSHVALLFSSPTKETKKWRCRIRTSSSWLGGFMERDGRACQTHACDTRIARHRRPKVHWKLGSAADI